MAGKKFQRTVLAAAFGGVLIASGCAPIVNTHGYLPVAADVSALAVGADTKTSVLERLGEPTTKGVEGDNSWYYVSYTVSTLAFFAPDVTDRQILAISFNGTDRVAAVNTIGLENGIVVDLNTGETPTGGRSLSFWQQMLGNVGNFSAESFL
ncbi:MAG: outer membrane protein assembly factor BamE [Rhodobacteraceae bacterium]|nr:outer membrane protein assembly factor BamE [Paracoccaceae bacterium]